MAEERPSTAVTLPRNFHFHEFAQDKVPKTPERDPKPQVDNEEIEQQVPRPPQRYLLRNFKKQSRANLRPSLGLGFGSIEDMPIPTIEIPDEQDTPSSSSSYRQRVESELSLTTSGNIRRRSLPRTPPPQSMLTSHANWSPVNREAVAASIGHLSSATPIDSDSSDDSDADSEDYLSYGGSCTSPESEVGSLGFRPAKPRALASQLTFEAESPLAQKKGKGLSSIWTPEMDNHLWTCYMKYLSDPTVTPFKSWPGAAPPLGVCRRVAREAKRMWKGPRPNVASPEASRSLGIHRNNSSDTITAFKSGSNTPTEPCSNQKTPVWPKSNASTRRRFREICKRKASIAPHYQRMLKSRSPEPFSSGSTNGHRTRFSASGASATRDVRLSLATSTSVSMQPDGPLAQLAGRNRTRGDSISSWFNDLSVPWASPAPQPSSELNATTENSNQELPTPLDRMRFPSDPPRLGSPFQYHTWTPGNLEKRSRRSMRPVRLDNVGASIPRLRSPFEMRGTFPYPSNHKRRAQSQLEEELVPVDSNRRQLIDDDVFGGPLDPSQRRVRARGFSYGDALTQGRLPRYQTPPLQQSSRTMHRFTTPPPLATVAPSSPSLQPPAQTESQMRLGSPFAGISSRPTRSRRHISQAAGPATWDSPAYPSIDQTLEGSALHRDRGGRA